MSRKFIIDTDTASDDAVALIMALRAPEVEVAAITVVSGNMPLEQGLRNALYTVEMCDADVPVYAGAARPLLRDPIYAFWFHGQDGMGDQNYPQAKRQPQDKHAVTAMIETIKANPGIVLVTLGPLTNVAQAVSQAPEIVSNVGRCVIMGGNPATVGNVTPGAEYNMWVDPEAARIVFHSGLPIELLGWELSLGEAVLTADDIAHVHSLDTPLAHFAMDCNRQALRATKEQSGEDGLSIPDPIAMAIALDPTICMRQSSHYVDIETQSELTRGATVVDALDVVTDERNRVVWNKLLQKEPNAAVCWELDAARWKALLYETLRGS